MPSPFKVGIIGAGPAGLALARFLHLNKIQFSVFEREASPDVRSQGGTLDLHEESGQKALKETGLWDEIEKVLRREGEDVVVVDKFNRRFVEEIAPNSNRPELDRVILRKVLLKSIPAETIQWGVQVKSVGERGIIQVVDGEEIGGFDLIVGADGAWSRVRPIISPSTPTYAGISGVDLRLHNVDQEHAAVAKLVGNGTFCALGDSRSLIAQRNGDGSIRVNAWARRSEDWLKTCGIDFKNPSITRAAIAEDYGNWAPELKQLIIEASDDIIPRALYILPLDHTWQTKPGFTIVGDAAHLMTPFAGEGVNLALIDAYDLATAIINTVKSNTPLIDSIRDFEKKMQVRARNCAEESQRNLEVMHSEDAVRRFKEVMPWLNTLIDLPT